MEHLGRSLHLGFFAFNCPAASLALGPVGCGNLFGILCPHPKGNVCFLAHFLQQWNLPSLSGFIFGLPLEELVWALGFGFTWPVFMAHVFDVQVRREAFPVD